MATYLVRAPKQITRHEGDLADISIIVPEILSLAVYGVRFQVKDSSGRSIFRKDTADATITVAGQTANIALLPADTKGRAGNHKWEAELYNQNGPITIGYGQFVINPELIK
jgi:hypothetical protein